LYNAGLEPVEEKMLIRTHAFLLLVLLSLLVSLTASGKPRKVRRVQTGDWGGNHIRLHVTANGGEIDYDCANGQIESPMTFDSRGHFTWRGVHNQEHPGPTREDDPGTGQPVTYTGWVKGDTMNLTVKRAGTNESIGTFTLTRGGGGRIFKCR
jgi:hypothetical protein